MFEIQQRPGCCLEMVVFRAGRTKPNRRRGGRYRRPFCRQSVVMHRFNRCSLLFNTGFPPVVIAAEPLSQSIHPIGCGENSLFRGNSVCFRYARILSRAEQTFQKRPGWCAVHSNGSEREPLERASSAHARPIRARRSWRTDVSVDASPVRRYLTIMKTTISSKGQIVLPADLRERDHILPGQQFEVERLQVGEYLLRKTPVRGRTGLLDWLRSCPAEGWFRSIPSESTDEI